MSKVDVVMPKMGESVMEGTVLTWHKKPGDTIEADETLLEIGTDKVDSEIPSPEGGRLAEILVKEGDTVEVGTVLARIETDSDAEVSDSDDDETESSEKKAKNKESDKKDAAAKKQDSKDSAKPAEDEKKTREAAGEKDVESKKAVKKTGQGIEVIMPKMGESVMEGTVLSWHKKEGESVETDEVLLEIGTDKVDTEIPSPSSGVLNEILVQEGETVSVGTVLARLEGEGADTDEETSESTKTESTSSAAGDRQEEQEEPTGQTQEKDAERGSTGESRNGQEELAGDRFGSDGRFYSPLVRSIAKTEGISKEELESIDGSGREGRITKKDIMSYVETRGSGPERVETTERDRPSPVMQAESVGMTDDGRAEIFEMDRMRKVIAEHMTRSLATSAHVTSFAEADLTNLVRLREREKAAFQQREGVKLTYTPFFVKAAVDALREHPILNSSVDEDRILIKKDFHVGIAVAIARTGLVVPVIRNAGGLNVTGLAHAAADLAERARNKELQPDELQGGTFTVTNVGSLGSIMGTPIINQPQVAILATGAIKKRPVVKEDPELGDVITVRQIMYLSLSYDHRIIDGAMAASFLRYVVDTLESFDPESGIQ